MRFTTALLVVLLAAEAQAWPGAVRVSEDNVHMGMAATDLRIIPHEYRCYVRYVSVPQHLVWKKDGAEEGAQLTALAVNYWSQLPDAYKPLALGAKRDEEYVVVRVDLRALATGKNLDLLIRTWEEFRFDPTYNLIVTPDEQKIVRRKATEDDYDWRLENVAPYVQEGKTYTQKWVSTPKKGVVIKEGYVHERGAGVVIREVAPHLERQLVAELVDGTRSQAPIVSLPYLIARGLRTVKDRDGNKDTLYSTLYGGLYFELANVPRRGKKGTDLDAILESLGVGNVDAGITPKALFDRLQTDQRSAQEKSGVTGRSRQITYLPTLGVSLKNGRGLLILTLDNRRRDIDLKNSAVDNLLDFRAAGSEGIWERPNGLHGFGAFDAQGNLVDQVPDDIAADTTIPNPHGTVLESAISCIRCHRSEGGWRKVKDSVRARLKSGRFSILDDLSFKDREAALLRINGLYGWDPEEPDGVLTRGRNDYARNILKVTGPWKRSKAVANLDIVKASGDALAEVFNEETYGDVNARVALARLGIRVKYDGARDDAAKNDIARKHLADLVTVPGPGLPEDGRLLALLEGESISRDKWDLLRARLAIRIFGAQRN